MSQDISPLLRDWEFNPHELNVRLITDEAGNNKIQMRIDLGLLQMELEGRPDGKQPNGCESLLEHLRHQANEYGHEYRLSSDVLEELFRECWQYYQRYLCLFHLGMHEAVIRDTERNLELFAFVRQYAKRRRDAWRFDQYRPYALMMNTRARGILELDQGNITEALTIIDAGCDQLRAFLAEYDQPEREQDFFELEFLQRWREELTNEYAEALESSMADTNADEEFTGKNLEGSNPELDVQNSLLRKDQLEALRRQLEEAVQREDYEHAALLRDQIRQLERRLQL